MVHANAIFTAQRCKKTNRLANVPPGKANQVRNEALSGFKVRTTCALIRAFNLAVNSSIVTHLHCLGPPCICSYGSEILGCIRCSGHGGKLNSRHDLPSIQSSSPIINIALTKCYNPVSYVSFAVRVSPIFSAWALGPSEPIFTDAAARINGGFRKIFGRSPKVFNANHSSGF